MNQIAIKLSENLKKRIAISLLEKSQELTLVFIKLAHELDSVRSAA